jgi:hypothetical protein
MPLHIGMGYFIGKSITSTEVGGGNPQPPYAGVIITSQPSNWSGIEGAAATFTVIATSEDASPLSYQWEENVSGSGWEDTVDGGSLSGSTTATLTISPTVIPDSSREFRVNVTNDTNTRVSVIVTLTITGASFFIIDENGNRQITEVLLNNIMDERSL